MAKFHWHNYFHKKKIKGSRLSYSLYVCVCLLTCGHDSFSKKCPIFYKIRYRDVGPPTFIISQIRMISSRAWLPTAVMSQCRPCALLPFATLQKYIYIFGQISTDLLFLSGTLGFFLIHYTLFYYYFNQFFGETWCYLKVVCLAANRLLPLLIT